MLWIAKSSNKKLITAHIVSGVMIVIGTLLKINLGLDGIIFTLIMLHFFAVSILSTIVLVVRLIKNYI